MLPKPAFVTQMQKHKVRALKTMCLYLAYTALGMVSGMSGPTILDLQLTVGTTFDQITYVIPGRSVGYAIGSLFVGVTFAYVNVQALIAITCGLSAIFLGILPFNRTLWGLILTFFANGIVNGMLDTGSNLMTLVLWGKENGPFMQALHFSFGLGAFHAPLLAKPFLLELLEPAPNRTLDENSTLDYQDYVFPEYTVDDVALEIPYGVMSVFMIINSLVFGYLFLKFRETRPHPSRMISETMEKMGGAFKMNRRVRYTIVVLATLFMHIYCGLELAFGTLITSYAVKSDLKLDKATGAVMASVYWAFFTFFRLFAIFFADIIGAENNIYFNFSLIAMANFFLIPFGGTNVYCLWAGIILMGLGTSSIWASIFGFLEDYFPVTSGITASFSVAACLGQSLMPFIVGYFIDSYPPIFLWVTLAASLMLIILFSVFSYLCKHCLRKKTLT